jgi:ketosteroid isomerase-like protein
VKGRQNIQEWMEGFPKMGMKMVSIKFTTVSVEGKGSTAYEIGKYDQTFTIAGGPEMKDAGKYVAIWKKQQDGSWKLAVDIWNTDTPLPMPEPPKATAKKK